MTSDTMTETSRQSDAAPDVDVRDVDVRDESVETDVRYGTRWGRSALLLAPAAVAIAALGGALTSGVLALDVATQNGETNVSLSDANLGAASIYPIQQTVKESNGTTATHWFLALQIKDASLDRLCTTQKFGVLGLDFSLKLDLAGPVSASGVLVTITKADIGRLGLDGKAVILNQQASDTTVGAGGPPSRGGNNLLGLQVDTGDADTVSGLLHTGDIANVSASTIGISVTPGQATC